MTSASNNPTTNTKAQQAGTDTAPPTLVDKALAVVFATGVLSFFAVHFLAGALVPLDATDIAHSSWLGYSLALWAHQVPGTAMACVVVVMALVTGFVQRSLPAAGALLLIALGMHLVTSPEMAYRASISAGNAKVGCYVWESKECHELMGLNNTDARSIYLPSAEANARGTPYADWYGAERPKFINFAQVIASLPGGFGTNALVVALNSEKINQLLKDQRAELERRKQEMLKR